MNLRQLRYICEVAKRDDLSISAVARALHTNQPGVSKQIKLLEDELGVALFERSKNRLTALTPEGREIVAHAQIIVDEAMTIRAIGKERILTRSGPLVIAVTHTQARYVLPQILRDFAAAYPKVKLTMRHADPRRIAEMLASGEADLGITTNEALAGSDIVALPFRQFQRVVIVPRSHPLTQVRRLTLKHLAHYPLVTYEPAFTAREDVLTAFRAASLEPRVVISAIDGDVIKTCVEQGLGYAVLSEVAYDKSRDASLVALPAGHLFPPATTRIWLWRTRYIRRYTYDFIEQCSPQWTRAKVEQMQRKSARAVRGR